MRVSLLTSVVLLLLALGTAEATAEKTLVYHLNGAVESLDPAKSMNSLRARRVMWPIFEALVNLSKNPQGVVPELAQSWDASPDGLTYVFHLRRGVKFHDGSPLTAAAVKVNLERNYLKGSRFYTAEPPNVREEILSGLIRDITIQDDHTITIALKNPRMHLLFMIPIASPDALARQDRPFGEHPVGTGPFKFSRWAGDEIRLVSHAEYWGGRPKIDQLVFKTITGSDKTMQDFLAGKIDFLPEVEPLYLERIIATPSTKLIRAPTLSLYYLGFRTDQSPFSDPRLRQAVTRAIDVERTILFTSRGTGIPAFGPIPPGAEGHDESLKKSRYSPDAARQLLRTAGRVDPKVSLLFNAGWGFFTELAHAIKADLGKVGMTVDLVPLPSYKDLVADVRQGKGDMFMYSWFTVLPDADVWLGRLFPSKSVDNLTRYSNPQVDGLLHQARNIANPAAREARYRQIQKIIVDDAPILPLFHEVRISAYNTRVSGLELNVQSFPVDRFARIDIRTE